MSQNPFLNAKHDPGLDSETRKNLSFKDTEKEIFKPKCAHLGNLPGVPVVKNPPSNAGDTGSIPG